MVGHRSAKLDILRAISVLLVLGRHLPLPPSVPAVVATWHRGGWIGVDLFFVLSGFLVSGLLFREQQRTGSIRPGRFLLRRGLKIYPAFWVMIATTLVLWPDHVYPGILLSELLFMQSYGGAIWNHTWSLAVEEHFYLLLVQLVIWLVALKRQRPFAWLPVLFVLVAIGDLWLRSVTVGPNFTARYTPSHLRMDALFCGVTLAYLYHYHRTPFLAWATRWRVLLAATGVAMLIPPFVWSIETTPTLLSVGLTAIYLGAAAMLIVSLTLPEPTHAFWRGVAYIGSHSYSIYLWHMGVNVWIVPRLHPSSWMTAATTSLVPSVLVGIGMAKLVELPVLRVRERYWPADADSRSAPQGCVT